MLTEFEIKNLQTLKKMLDEIKDQRAAAEKGLKEIDDKYKAIIEKEKKDYRQTLSMCKKEIEFWEKPIMKRYGKPVDDLLAKPEDAGETESVDPDDQLPFGDPEDEKVVDAEAEKTVEETVEQEEEPVGVSDDEAPEFDGAGFTEADNVEPETVAEEQPAKEAKAEDDNWEEETESKEQKDDDDWPDFPEEWK